MNFSDESGVFDDETDAIRPYLYEPIALNHPISDISSKSEVESISDGSEESDNETVEHW